MWAFSFARSAESDAAAGAAATNVPISRARANFVVKIISNSWDLPREVAFTH
jgi:hypothetical protein